MFAPSKPKFCFFRDLLSSLSQVLTFPFQSHVCLSMSNANPLGHVICFRPDLVHLCVKYFIINSFDQETMTIPSIDSKKKVENPICHNKKCFRIRHSFFCVDLLSRTSQFGTFPFQSQVWRSMSKAKPPGHLTLASLVAPLTSLFLSHLYKTY